MTLLVGEFELYPMPTPEFSFTPPAYRLIAHRGLSARAPENTLASFEMAANSGINCVEFDVRLTKDNVLIVFHDDKLDRTTNGSGWVHETPSEIIASLDCGKWFSPEFSGQSVPFFVELLPRLFALNLNMNIELKMPPSATQAHQNALVAGMASALKHWPSQRPLPIVSSFHWELVDALRNLFPALPIGFLSRTCDKHALAKASRTPNCAIHCDHEVLTPSIIEQTHSLSIPLLAYTVNDPLTARQLLEAGVFSLFTDDPAKIAPLDRYPQSA